MWSPFKRRRANLVLHFARARRRFRIVDRGGYESRNGATIHLLVEALERCKAELPKSFSLPIYTDDFVARPPGVPHFAYCSDGAQPHTIAIPDFLFWGWPQVGLGDYEQTVDKILDAGSREPDDQRLFWIGNPATHPTRERFLAIAAGDPRISAVAVNWIKSGASGHGKMATVDNRYVSLEDHCRYRYLIDLEGRGYSARVKLLLFSGRPLFLQERRWKEFFYADLVPYVHYIPVREDLSDLGQMLDWAEGHAGEARQIAERARQYAIAHLRRPHAIDRLAADLVKVASL